MSMVDGDANGQEPAPELIAFVKALAQSDAARDVRREKAEARRRIAEEQSPRPATTVDIPQMRTSSGFEPADLTRALKASLKAGITPHRVELLPDGRILLHYTAPPPLPGEG